MRRLNSSLDELEPGFRNTVERALIDVNSLWVPSMGAFEFRISETFRSPGAHKEVLASGDEHLKLNVLGSKRAVRIKLYSRLEKRFSNKDEDRDLIWAYNMLISLLRGKYRLLSGKDLKDEYGRKYYDHGLFYKKEHDGRQN